MINYQPIEYTFQPSPLVFIQGLGKDGVPEGAAKNLRRPTTPIVHNPLLIDADRIIRKAETVRASLGLEFVDLFKKYSLTEDCCWNDDLIKSQIDAPVAKYRLKFVDNEFLLPRFAKETVGEADELTETTQVKGHNKSLLSPFNENSDLYPDGIISANWIQKYKDIVPAVFISVHELVTDASETDQKAAEEELVEEIKSLKDNITQRGIKFLPIIISSKSIAMNPDLVDSINRIKKSTGLTGRNSLLFLPSGSERELKSFISHALSLLNSLSSEFYTSIEKKIKRKKSRQSSAQTSQLPQGLLQPFWDTRYYVKLAMIAEFKSQIDVATKLWEQSDTAILEIFKSLPKEHSRWNEFRMLLDFITLHSVRNALYMEDCNYSYTRFDTHLQNVITFLKRHDIKPRSYSVLTWLVAQFSWYADLLEYVPQELVPMAEPYRLTSDSALSMPNPGFLYLQAVSLTEKRRAQAQLHQEDEYVDTYISLPVEDEMKFDYDGECIGWLKKALLFFDKSPNFKRTEIYIKLEIAKYYANSEKYQDALEAYVECKEFLFSQKAEWEPLKAVAAAGIYECSLRLKDDSQAIAAALDLASLKSGKAASESDLPQYLEPVKSDAALVEAEFFFKHTDIHVSDECECQLSLNYHLNEESRKFVQIARITLEFEEGGSILPLVVVHDPALGATEPVQKVKCVKTEQGVYEGAANFDCGHAFQCFQMVGIFADRIGKSTLRGGIKIEAKFHDRVSFELDVALAGRKAGSHRYAWLSLRDGTVYKDFHRIVEPLTMKILPRRPKTEVSTDEIQNTYYIGETLSLPVTIKNDDHEKVTVTLEAVLEFASHWSVEDEHQLKVELDPGSQMERDLHFTIPLNFAQKTLRFPLKVSYFAGDNFEVPIQEEIRVHVEIVPPLKGRMTLLPRFRAEDMPSPFANSTGTKVPVPTRYWNCRTSVVAHGDVEIVDHDIELEHGPEYDTKVFADTKATRAVAGATECDECFYTRSGDGTLHRDIPVTLKSSLRWRRRGCDEVNVYRMVPLETSLSLFDPRVLLIAIEEPEAGAVRLQYVIENPAPRIFQFTTALSDEPDVEVVGGDLKKNSFPVMPFTRQVLTYTVKIGDGAKIPALKVYELQYKVHLPILPTDDVVSADGVYVKSR